MKTKFTKFKSLTLIVCFKMLTINSHSQPNYNYIDGMLLIGDSVRYHITNWTTAGSSGSNQVWDFSTLQDLGITNDATIDPSSTPFGSNYLSAQLATGNIFGYGYHTQSETDLQSLGSADLNTFVSFSDPWQTRSYPMTYGSNWADSFSGSGNSNGNSFSSSGFCLDTVDGWGNLILPNGTFENVLRLDSRASYSEVYLGGDIHQHDWETYEWLIQGYNRPLLVFHRNTDTINGSQVNQVTYAAYLDTIFSKTAIENRELISSLITLMPNPASNFVTVFIKSSYLNSNEVTINLKDIAGRTIAVKSSKANYGSITEKFDISALVNGVYFFEIIDGKQHVFEKLIIE